MNANLLDNFKEDELIGKLTSCFPAGKLEELARASGFVRRSTSQLTGSNFLLLNIAGSVMPQNMSLRESCIWLEDEFQIRMRKQSLDERYNTDAVLFMKRCFEQVLACVNGCSTDYAIKFPFSCVQLTDATLFRIPDSLAAFYEGFGGNFGASVLKIHLNYNLLDSSIADISLRSGKENDKKYFLAEGEQIIKNGLYVRDLGYFQSDFFQAIADGGAFFLSRGLTNITYYLKTNEGWENLDLGSVLPKPGESVDLEVYLGKDKNNRTRCRLILESVPEQVRQQRLSKVDRKRRSSKNWNVSAFRKQMCGYNMFVTNAPKEQLPLSSVRHAYRLRWQIELVFKIWKSIFHIDKVKQMSIFRFECHLYATLISILLSLNIEKELEGFLWNEYGYEISPTKAVGILKKRFRS